MEKLSIFRLSLRYSKDNTGSIAVAVYHGEGVTARGRSQQQLVDETGFPHKALIEVPPEGGICVMVRHAEHHALHLAGQLAGKVQDGAGAGIDKLHHLVGSSLPGGPHVLRMMRLVEPLHSWRQHKLPAAVIGAGIALQAGRRKQHLLRLGAVGRGQHAGGGADFGKGGGISGDTLASLGMTNWFLEPFI